MSLLTATLVAFLLAACTKDAVVVQPIALAPVASRLKAIPSVPKCDLPIRADYDPREVAAYAACWRSAYDALFVKHKGLINAVLQRERTTANAVALAKS